MVHTTLVQIESMPRSYGDRALIKFRVREDGVIKDFNRKKRNWPDYWPLLGFSHSLIEKSALSLLRHVYATRFVEAENDDAIIDGKINGLLAEIKAHYVHSQKAYESPTNTFHHVNISGSQIRTLRRYNGSIWHIRFLHHNKNEEGHCKYNVTLLAPEPEY